VAFRFRRATVCGALPDAIDVIDADVVDVYSCPA
jgi:hypothetical protein